VSEIHTDFHEANAGGIRALTDLGIAEVDHRVANSLSIAAAMLRMQRRQASDSAVRSAILSAEARVANIARFHTYLHQYGIHERVDLAGFFSEVLPKIAATIGLRCVLTVNASSTLDVSAHVARQLMIIVNELALNSLKHGHDGREGGRISVELEGDDRNYFRIRFADSGAGLPDDFDPTTCRGLGLRIVSSLVRELRGSLTAYSDDGAHFTIEIPID